MGIQGLLPFLEKSTKPCHLSEFRGATVAVDTYCWLHKGATACAFQLASGEDTRSLINYCLKYIKLLQSFDIKPILVFDGKNLPAKAETESKRRETRNKAKQRGTELIKLGKTDEARTYLKQSINITPEMAVGVIKECQQLQIDCIVAPYESDAQLAFFNLKGIAEVVITEDSDLMLFGCSKVLYKLDIRGCGYLVEAEKIPTSMKMRPDNYTFEKFRYMCILSGCDYVGSLQGIGLKKAEKFIKLTEEVNPLVFLDKLPRYLNMRHLKISEEYKESFMIADATFRHQTVFDPFKRQLVPLTNPDVYGTHEKYCKNAGDIFDHETAYQIALGNIHPKNLKSLNNWSPTKTILPKNSIWSGIIHKSISRKQQQYLSKKMEVPQTENNREMDDELKAAADKKIDLEIASYFKKPENSKIEMDSKDLIEEKRKRISPLLQNPFLKKISKFQMTKSDSDIIVKSRYFCSHIDTKQIETKLDLEENSEETVKKTIISDFENVPENSKESSVVALSKIKLSETFYEKSTDTSDHETNSSTVEILSGNISMSQPCLSSNLNGGSNAKRKKLSSCRAVGLKRIKSDGQPTMFTFFNKLQKK